MFGKLSGERAAKADIERLQMVWPIFPKLAERDRAFLAGLSLTCRLYQQPLQRAMVVACLRSAASNPEVLLPVGEGLSDPSKRLERLLEAASRQD